MTTEFIHVNHLKLICRAHQLVHEGYKYMFDGNLITIWSAPNYCYRCGNIASIVKFNSVDNRVPTLFQAVPNEERVIPDRVITPYFLWFRMRLCGNTRVLYVGNGKHLNCGKRRVLNCGNSRVFNLGINFCIVACGNRKVLNCGNRRFLNVGNRKVLNYGIVCCIVAFGNGRVLDCGNLKGFTLWMSLIFFCPFNGFDFSPFFIANITGLLQESLHAWERS